MALTCLKPSTSPSATFRLPSSQIPRILRPPAKTGGCFEHSRRSSELLVRGRPLRGGVIVCGAVLPADPWSPSTIDSQGVASQLFAASLFPYLGFLYFLTKSKSAPKLTLFGFYFLLAFVGATTATLNYSVWTDLLISFMLVFGATASMPMEQYQLEFTPRCTTALTWLMWTGYMAGQSLYSLSLTYSLSLA